MKTNYHTHTNFCDGKNTPEEIVLAAIKAGFSELGFSSHAAHPFAASWHLQVSRYAEYVNCIKSLAKKYEEKIKILCGFEVDFLPPVSAPDKNFYKTLGADYVIGSVHYVPDKTGAKMTAVDASSGEVQNGIDKNFGGSGKKLVKAYYAQVRKMLSLCDFDILGHIDVVRRRNDDLHFFCEDDAWYKRELQKTAAAAGDACKKKGIVCEINTGGMARNGMKEPYPSKYFFELLKKNGVRFIFSSDAHKTEHLDFAFESIKNTYGKVNIVGNASIVEKLQIR